MVFHKESHFYPNLFIYLQSILHFNTKLVIICFFSILLRAVAQFFKFCPPPRFNLSRILQAACCLRQTIRKAIGNAKSSSCLLKIKKRIIKTKYICPRPAVSKQAAHRHRPYYTCQAF